MLAWFIELKYYYIILLLYIYYVYTYYIYEFSTSNAFTYEWLNLTRYCMLYYKFQYVFLYTLLAICKRELFTFSLNIYLCIRRVPGPPLVIENQKKKKKGHQGKF